MCDQLRQCTCMHRPAAVKVKASRNGWPVGWQFADWWTLSQAVSMICLWSFARSAEGKGVALACNLHRPCECQSFGGYISNKRLMVTAMPGTCGTVSTQSSRHCKRQPTLPLPGVLVKSVVSGGIVCCTREAAALANSCEVNCV